MFFSVKVMQRKGYFSQHLHFLLVPLLLITLE